MGDAISELIRDWLGMREWTYRHNRLYTAIDVAIAQAKADTEAKLKTAFRLTLRDAIAQASREGQEAMRERCADATFEHSCGDPNG